MGGPYIDTTRQLQVGELKIELELPPGGLQSSFTAQNDLVLKERGVPISVVTTIPATVRYDGRIRRGKLGSGAGVLKGTDIAVQCDGQVCHTDGLDDGEDNKALDMVTGRVLAMRLL